MAEAEGPESPEPPEQRPKVEPPPSPFDRAIAWARPWMARAGDALPEDGASLLGRLAWPTAFAVAIAALVWPLLHPAEIQQLLKNELPVPRRNRAIEHTAGALAITFAVYAIAIGIRRVWTKRFSAGDTVDRLNRAFSFVVPLPLLLLLRYEPVEKSAPLLVIVVAALVAGFAARSAYFAEAPAIVERIMGRRFVAPLLAGASIFAMWAAYSVFFTRLAVVNHRAFNTQTADLGYYDNIFYQSLHGEPLGCSFMKGGVHYTGHFDPILVLLSPLYALYPRAEMLLGLQSVWLGSSVVPLYLLVRHHGHGRILGIGLAAVFALYPALHGVNMYEFHSLALIVPLVLWLLYFLESHRLKLFAVAAALTLTVREDAPLLLAFVGFYAMLSGDRWKVRPGAFITAAAAIYFVVVKALIMGSPDPLNSSKETISFGYYYKDLLPAGAETTGQLVVTLLTNPALVVKSVFTEPKLLFFLQLFVPLALLPFFAKRRRIMLVYGLAFLFLASKEPVFTVHFQYTAVLFPIAFALVPAVLERVRASPVVELAGFAGAKLCRAFVAFAFVATLVVSWKFGGIVDNQTFRGGFRRVVREPTEAQVAAYAWLEGVRHLVPGDASVAVTGSMGPHFSNRMVGKFWRDRREVDYLVVNEKEFKAADKTVHQREIASGELREVARHETYAIFKTHYDDRRRRK